MRHPFTFWLGAGITREHLLVVHGSLDLLIWGATNLTNSTSVLHQYMVFG